MAISLNHYSSVLIFVTNINIVPTLQLDFFKQILLQGKSNSLRKSILWVHRFEWKNKLWFLDYQVKFSKFKKCELNQEKYIYCFVIFIVLRIWPHQQVLSMVANGWKRSVGMHHEWVPGLSSLHSLPFYRNLGLKLVSSPQVPKSKVSYD